MHIETANIFRIPTSLYTSAKFTHCICSNLQGCGDGIPLGMGNGYILDDTITSSSETQQNPAHLGRLGGNSYWCSEVESISHLEISLPKKQKITNAVVDVFDDEHIRGVALLAKYAVTWYPLTFEKVMTLLRTF